MKKSARAITFLSLTRIFSIALIYVLSATAIVGAQTPKYAAGELLIQTKAGSPGVEISGALAAQNATILREIDQIRVKRIRVPLQALEKVRAALSKDPHFQFVEYNYLTSGAIEPNDTEYPSQWHLPQINAPAGWDHSVGSLAEPIAIIDSGVSPSHPDLADKIQAGYNFIGGNTEDTSDVLGHGTAVAGTAAAIIDNDEGVAGVAWNNPIMPLVVLNSDDFALYSDIADAITYAVDHGVRVMNISIGGSSSSSILQEAINYAWNHGALVIAAAHNYHTDTPYYPAACDHAVAVSATNESDQKASFSNYGNWIDVAAPGSSILTTNRYGGYGNWNGTSFSSPIVAGLAALIWSVAPSLTNAEVLAIITQNTDDLGSPGFDIYFGHGRVNVFTSLEAAVNRAPAQYNVYYGHLHNHSNVSDGTGTPASAYDYAKNVAGLDFFGLADHAFMISSNGWNSIKAAANAYNQDGVFATLWGFEWSSNGNWGHIAVINTPDYCTSVDSATDTFDELVSWLATRDGIAFFNHPGREDDNHREFNHFNSQPSDKFVGIELFNKSDGFSVYYYNDGYYSNDGNKSYYDEALERGWDIGASGSEDNHDGTWGTQTDYRMAVLAEAKTRTAIYNAIKERRFFSTLDNIALSFELGGQQMGSIVNPGTYECVIEATDGDAELFTEIQLIKNGEIIQTWYPNSAFPFIVHQVTTYAGEYYYVKVTQTDGDEAISSPISVVGGNPPDTEPPTPNPMMWLDPPHAIDSGSIGMTANTAIDPSGVEYYFTCVAGGGHDSGWQTSPSYVDYNLSPNTEYTYTVKARDLSANLNETGESAEKSAVTLNIVNTPPYFTSDPIIEVDGVEGVSYNSSIADNATDQDPGDTLTFSKGSGGPAWLVVAVEGTLSGTPGSGDVGLNEWTVHVGDPDGDYDDAILQILVDAAGQDTDYRANGESTTRGTVSESYVNTQASDNSYEEITEEIKAGKWSQLSHTWTFDIVGNSSVVFMVEAHHSANSEGDDFVFAYSTDNVVFTEMFTVTKTSDNDISQSYELPPATSGTVYVRVTDTDNTRGNIWLDALYVDDMLIYTSGTLLEPGAAFNISPADGAINVALDALLTWYAGAGAEWHDLYFGTDEEDLSLVSPGPTTTSYDPPGDMAEATNYFWRVDEGNSAGTTTGPIWRFKTTGGICAPSKISVHSIVIEQLRGSKGQSFGQVTVTVLDDCGNPVSDADVTGYFTGDFSDELQQTVASDDNGQAVFKTTDEIKKPVFSFIVYDVSAENLIYTTE
jgi:subtilisin family serine protease